MRFGRNLHRHKFPLWASSYLDYNGLKERIRLSKANQNDDSNLTQLFDRLASDMSQVQAFYEIVYAATWDEVSSVSVSSYLQEQDNLRLADEHELRFHLEALVQCCISLERLRSFGTVNSRGFKRLLGKLGHLKTHPSAAILDELELHLSTIQFSCQTELVYSLGRLEVSITAISEILSCRSFLSQRSLILDQFVEHSALVLKNINDVYVAIKADNVVDLENFCRDHMFTDDIGNWPSLNLVPVLIQLSIIYQSATCLKKLLRLLQSFHGNENFAKDYLPLVIIQIIVRIGHHKMFAESPIQMAGCVCEGIPSTHINNMVPLLMTILETFGAYATTSLSTKDKLLNRAPIHYVAEYGLLDVCEILLNRIQDEEFPVRLQFCESILLKDFSGSSPLLAAISCGFEEVARRFLEFLRQNGCLDADSWKLVSGPLLFAAISSINASSEFLESLLAAKPDVNYQGYGGETALYIATRYRNEKLVAHLLALGASTTLSERSKGWTPLIISSSEGLVSVVDLLLEAGASAIYRDHRGWTALDYAAFGGHMKLCQRLRQFVSHITPYYGPSQPAARVQPAREISKANGENVILVNIGSFDSTKSLVPVDLMPYQRTNISSPGTGDGLSIRISLIGGDGPYYKVDLPILEDLTNKPWAFHTPDLDNVKLLFEIYRESVTEDRLKLHDHIGSAVALLAGLKEGLGPTRESLVRDYQIPILSKGDLNNIGSITFSFIVVKPFSSPKFPLPARDTLWRNSKRTKVVGHRGLGANKIGPKRLSIGENTAESFLSAVHLGADWVELDVQLTRDLVPVLYHDFLVSETGTDAWIHNLRLQQFMHISNSQSRPKATQTKEGSSRKVRSYSLDASNDVRPIHITEQLKQTFDFQQKGFKSNIRGYCIQQPFLTLQDLLSQTPDSLPLNIEFKYPMLFEAAVEFQSDIFATEVNLFVDTILSSIISHPSSRSRPIIISSFSPEVCILLLLKQDMFPVLFLSESGYFPTEDIRASSLKEAVHFATSWGLDGIVMRSQPFAFSPLLVGFAKGKGLVTASFGELNDDPECAKMQAAAGLDQIIVDAVRLISKTLGDAYPKT